MISSNKLSVTDNLCCVVYSSPFCIRLHNLFIQHLNMGIVKCNKVISTCKDMSF